MGWHFKKQEPGDTSREPIQGEFFADESIEYAAAALVREGIQNSLDARAGREPAHVRIYYSGSAGALAPASTKAYLDGLWPHLEAPRNGLREPPSRRDLCPFLVFEDFGTTGLTGNPGQWHRVEGQPNGFFAFFRAEGLSDKTKSDRGRWGVGKFVFPRSSRISTFFGLTIRADDRRPLLLGRCILKSHSADHNRFGPDGYFGKRPSGALVLPEDSEDLISGFSRSWQLKRRRESGLSIVVPFCDEEISYQTLVSAVARDFFYAVVRGDLVVEIETPGEKMIIDHDRIDATVRSLGEPEVRDRVSGLLDLSRWALVTAPRELTTLRSPTSSGAPRFSHEMLSEEVLNKLRSSLAQVGGRFAVRVPVEVRPKKSASQPSYFDVFVERAGSDQLDRPVFVREGLIIPDVKSRRTRRVRSLVIIEDGPLAHFLGDSENPSHTRWHKDSSNFKGKYTYGPALIDLVTESVSQILGLLEETDTEIDRDLLVDLFSLTLPEGGSGAAKGDDKRKGKKTGPPVTPPPPKPKRVVVNQVAGGFRLSNGTPELGHPEMVEIHAAYDLRSGNPLKAYEAADFQLDKAPIVLSDVRGLIMEKVEANKIVVRVLKPEFEVTVKGFDPLRDLYVSVQEREA